MLGNPFPVGHTIPFPGNLDASCSPRVPHTASCGMDMDFEPSSRGSGSGLRPGSWRRVVLHLIASRICAIFLLISLVPTLRIYGRLIPFNAASLYPFSLFYSPVTLSSRVLHFRFFSFVRFLTFFAPYTSSVSSSILCTPSNRLTFRFLRLLWSSPCPHLPSKLRLEF
jgi:hypothetical protein